MVLEVFGNLIVQPNAFGSETVFGEGFVAFAKAPDEFLRFAGLYRGRVDIIGIIVVHHK